MENSKIITENNLDRSYWLEKAKTLLTYLSEFKSKDYPTSRVLEDYEKESLGFFKQKFHLFMNIRNKHYFKNEELGTTEFQINDFEIVSILV
jgi:hypothetical protein